MIIKTEIITPGEQEKPDGWPRPCKNHNLFWSVPSWLPYDEAPNVSKYGAFSFQWCMRCDAEKKMYAIPESAVDGRQLIELCKYSYAISELDDDRYSTKWEIGDKPRMNIGDIYLPYRKSELEEIANANAVGVG